MEPVLRDNLEISCLMPGGERRGGADPQQRCLAVFPSRYALKAGRAARDGGCSDLGFDDGRRKGVVVATLLRRGENWARVS